MTEPESSLRERARLRIAERGGAEPDGPLAVAELRKAVHELHVHEIELELQNEELQQAQRRLEESRVALAASEHRYRELFERAPLGYLRLDQDGAILEANETAAELLAAGKSWLRGRKFTDFIESRHQDDYYFHRRAVLGHAPPAPVQVALRAHDGRRRVVELSSRSIERDPQEIRIAILDVTAREHAETERAESERQRRLMADVLPLAISYIGADGRYEFCNEAFRKLFGSRADAVEGRAIFEVLEPSHYDALRDHVREALGGASTRFEGELSFPETGPRFVSVLLAPDPAPDGWVRGFYALVDDRTDLETARRGLREAAAQSSLAEERERRALAADLHDDVGQLIALASIKLREHEKKIADPASIESLREIADLVRAARRRIATLSFELSPPLLYDVGFVAAAQWLGENLQQSYGLETVIDAAGEIPPLDEVSRVTLFRATRELLINAAKHSGVRHARVSIRGAADGVSLVIADGGVGFDPASETRGFGLRNVLERIHSLGGRIEVESAPGRGAKVSIWLPASSEGET